MKFVGSRTGAMVAVLSVGALAEAATYYSQPNLSVGDAGNPLSVPFAVPQIASQLESIQITLQNVDFARMHDLHLALTGPTGSSFTVFTADDGPFGRATGTYIFNDEAADRFTWSGSLSGDEFMPSKGNFSDVFDAASYPAGNWTVSMHYDGAAGTFNIGQVQLDLSSTVPEPAALSALWLVGSALLMRKR